MFILGLLVGLLIGFAVGLLINRRRITKEGGFVTRHDLAIRPRPEPPDEAA